MVTCLRCKMLEATHPSGQCEPCRRAAQYRHPSALPFAGELFPNLPAAPALLPAAGRNLSFQFTEGE